MEYVIGIDGGGTSTKATVYEIAGNKVGRPLTHIVVGPSNLNSTSESEVKLAFRKILDELNRPGIVASGLGVAGISKNGVVERLQAILNELDYPKPFTIVGDQEAACVGALGERDGILLVAGTGSIAMASYPDGSTRRVGGFGHLLDDRGSAFAIGQAVLTSYLQAYDGRISRSLIHEALETALQVKASEAVAAILELAYATDFDKSRIARFATLVPTAAEAGDKLAMGIIDSGIDDLYRLILPLAQGFEHSAIPLVLAGGMLTADSIYRQRFIERLTELTVPFEVVEAEADAMVGAAALALKKLNIAD